MAGRPVAERALVPLRRNRGLRPVATGAGAVSRLSEASRIAYTLLVLADGLAREGRDRRVCAAHPYALFALPTGVAVDRFNRKWLMIWAEVIREMRTVLVVSAWLAVEIVAFVVEPRRLRARRGDRAPDLLQSNRERPW
jgi:hypothetical protein